MNDSNDVLSAGEKQSADVEGGMFQAAKDSGMHYSAQHHTLTLSLVSCTCAATSMQLYSQLSGLYTDTIII